MTRYQQAHRVPRHSRLREAMEIAAFFVTLAGIVLVLSLDGVR